MAYMVQYLHFRILEFPLNKVKVNQTAAREVQETFPSRWMFETQRQLVSDASSALGNIWVPVPSNSAAYSSE